MCAERSAANPVGGQIESETDIEKNADELGIMFAACEQGEEPKKLFLEALNKNASTLFRWVLRPKPWGSGKQWNVASVNEP